MRTALVGSELMTEAMRQEMYKAWGDHMNITQNYGMSELMGPGVSGECLELNGMHINEDHFIPEIIDPRTGEVLPSGEKGELVITCISKEALPLIRYRTKDITRLMYEPCKCGRTTVRMENLLGRTDDMLKIRGVNAVSYTHLPLFYGTDADHSRQDCRGGACDGMFTGNERHGKDQSQDTGCHGYCRRG